MGVTRCRATPSLVDEAAHCRRDRSACLEAAFLFDCLERNQRWRKMTASRIEEYQQMNLIPFTLSLHVLVAVLGVGTIGALPLAARGARRASVALGALAVWTRPLLLTARLSLLLAFATGVLLDFLFQGAFHRAVWFRLAGLLVVLTAVCLARAKAALAGGLSGALAEPVALRRLEVWGFTCVIAVAAVVVLMAWKPF